MKITETVTEILTVWKLWIVLPLLGALCCENALARQIAGSYLAARQAGYLGDFEASALYNARVISRDKINLKAMEELIVAYVAMGRIESAIKVTGDCLLYTSPSPRDQRGSRIAGCG